MIAHDLLVWCQRLLLTGDLARAEPKWLRYTLLHTAGIIARTDRRTRLRLAAGWPWAKQLVDAFDRCHQLRHTT